MHTAATTSLACLLALAACSTSGGSPSAAPSANPSPSPSTQASASPSSASPSSASPSSAAAFSLEVFPPEEPTGNRAAIPGSRYSFLVKVSDAFGGGPVTIAATASKAQVVTVPAGGVAPGTVGEVWVVADPATDETTGSVTITGTRAGVTQSATRSLPVRPFEDGRKDEAKRYFDLWVTWLAAEHPELGITAATTWEPVFVSALLVVSHYAYWSDQWEMTVAWHVMIPPYDWTEVHLRRRSTETAPSLAFRIDSVEGKTAAHAVAPPEIVVR